MYWTDYGSGDIRQANLDGSGQTALVTGQHQPVGIALDILGGKMYWCDISGGDIRRAADNFLSRAVGTERERFDYFCAQNEWWLEDFVLFDLLRERHGRDWSKWPSQLARRDLHVMTFASSLPSARSLSSE